MGLNLKALFRRQILVARVYRIPVRIDYRWFVMFALSVLLIASNLQQHTLQLGSLRLPPTGVVTAWILGLSLRSRSFFRYSVMNCRMH